MRETERQRERERERGVVGIGVGGLWSDSSGAGIGKIVAANKDEEWKSDGSSGGEGDHRQHCIILKLMLPNYSRCFP